MLQLDKRAGGLALALAIIPNNMNSNIKRNAIKSNENSIETTEIFVKTFCEGTSRPPHPSIRLYKISEKNLPMKLASDRLGEKVAEKRGIEFAQRRRANGYI